jgi:hypothetical protein
MYLSPRQSQQHETVLSTIRSDPTNDTLQRFIDDLDKAEEESKSVMKLSKGNSVKGESDAISSVFADARQILDLVRKR